MMGVAKPEHWEDLDSLREPTMPLIEEMSLQRKRKSLYCTVMQRAWDDAGEDLSNPGDVTEYLDQQSGLLLVEFGGSRDVKQLHRPDDDFLVIELTDA
jgi:hypothetical protein